ncbi:MAG: hypothetical protein JWN44_3296 [Myxococcales bacterium]|nr:hypothetical protein [Myxococcales bacterium]
MGQVPDDVKEIDAVEAEVDTLRDRTQQLVAELERRLRARASQAKHTIERVKHAVDVKEQIRLHPRVMIGVSTAAALALGIGVYVSVSRMLAARKPMNRLRRRTEAYRALLADPRRALRKKEPLGKRLLTAVLVAAATTLVKNVGTMLAKRAMQEPRRLPGREVVEVEYV